MQKKKKFNWPGGIFLISYQLALIFSLPVYLYYYGINGKMIAVAIGIFLLCGLGITAGYHRLFSHRAYEASGLIQFITLIFGTLATQGSAYEWSHDHRLHHRYVDTDRDPYSIKKGFLYAHFLWMLEARQDIDHAVVHDLQKNRMVMFQHNYYVPLLILSHLLVIGLFGWIFQDFLGAFVIIFLARLFTTHHTTWFINSLAHTLGSKPFSKEHSAVNNWLISFITFGEGYHNYHHTFASDYRNGVRWYQFDPTKMLIWMLSKVGLVKNLKRVDMTSVNHRILLEDKRILLSKLKEIPYIKWEACEKHVVDTYDRLKKNLEELHRRRREFKKHKQEASKRQRQKMKTRLIALDRSIKQDLKQWRRMFKAILRLKPTIIS